MFIPGDGSSADCRKLRSLNRCVCSHTTLHPSNHTYDWYLRYKSTCVALFEGVRTLGYGVLQLSQTRDDCNVRIVGLNEVNHLVVQILLVHQADLLVEELRGLVAARFADGGENILDYPLGEQLRLLHFRFENKLVQPRLRNPNCPLFVVR